MSPTTDADDNLFPDGELRRVGTLHGHDLVLRLGQAARFAGLAGTAGTVGGDPHIDRVAFRAFHHAAMFNP